MRGIARHRVGTLAGNLDEHTLVITGHRDELVLQAQGETGAIEGRPEIGARGGNKDANGVAGDHPSANPSSRAATSGSTGTITGSPALSSAHCGSLSPCPVNVHTMT